MIYRFIDKTDYVCVDERRLARDFHHTITLISQK